MLILSSSVFDDTKLLPFLIDAVKKPIGSIHVAILVSASPLKSNGPNAIRTMNYLRNHEITDVHFVDFDENKNAVSILENSDVIIILGGNPFLLLATLRKQDYLDRLRALALSNKIIVGVSAGGMIFSPGLHLLEEFNKIMGFDDKGNVENIEDLTCLNMFDKYFFPHIDIFSARVPDLTEKLRLIECERQVRIYKQANGHTALVTGRKIEVI